MHAVLVPPNKFRPPQHGTSGDGMFEHVQNMFYSKILTLNGDLAKAGVGTPPTEAGSKPRACTFFCVWLR